MHTAKKIYCRISQFVFWLAIPLLPYSNPELLDDTRKLPEALKKRGIQSIIIVTDKSIHGFGLIDPAKVVCGGQSNLSTLRIAPTVLNNVTPDDAVMGQEIFGPVLPVLDCPDTDAAIAFVNARPHPLALYIFSSDRAAIRRVTEQCNFGGGCVNDTIVHLATSTMGFGGTGESGMGAYHGKAGFDAFSTHKSILEKKNWLDLPMRYQPYKGLYGKLLHIFLK